MKSWQLWMLKVLLVAQVGLLAYLFVDGVADGKYFPAHEDEVINFCAARLYSETGSVRAEDCIDENVSRIGEMNWYGPGYHIIYGSMQKAFGDHATLFVQLHFVLALLTIASIFFFPVAQESKFLIAASVSFVPQFFPYVFSYFPETLQLFFASIMVLFLFSIHREEQRDKRRLYVILFVTLVLVLTICRVTSIFWLAALIGLSRSKREAWQTTVVFACGLVLSLIYLKLFLAPAYAEGVRRINDLFEFKVLGFVWGAVKGLLGNAWYLIASKSVAAYYLLTLLLICAIRWWKTRERFLLAAILVSVTLIAALLSFYTSEPWYFVKQSAVLVPFLLLGLMLSHSDMKLKFGVLVLSIASYALDYRGITQSIEAHRAMHVKLQDNEAFSKALTKIRDFIGGEESVTILYCYNEYDFGNTTQALLPFSTPTGRPILYTTNIVHPQDVPEVKFKLHGKLKVGYLLSRNPVEWPTLELLYTTPYFFFYRTKQ